MEKEGTEVDDTPVKFVWKRSYTWVLIFNAVYVLLFYWLMKSYIVYAG